MSLPDRTAVHERETLESRVRVALNLDGSGSSKISTTVPFFDHLLTSLSKHSLIDLEIESSGDTDVDIHHTVEDTAIVLGRCIGEALGKKEGIVRFGDSLVPLDDALARAVVDVSGRPYLVHTGEPEGFQYHLIGGHFTGSLVRHAFEAISYRASLTVHISVLDGRDPHHIAEAQFKAFARALRKAVSIDNSVTGVPSTKGSLSE